MANNGRRASFLNSVSVPPRWRRSVLKLWNRLALAALLLPLTAFAATAVTVDIDIVSKGEPVPGAEITFETAEGTEVTPQPPPPPSTDTPAVPDTKTEPSKT